MMTRRDLLTRSSAAALAYGLRGWTTARADESAPAKRVLFFTKSSDYEHAVIGYENGKPSLAERVLADHAASHGLAFSFSKDGSLFSRDYLSQFDAVMFYTTGDLLSRGKPGKDGKPKDGNPPMTPEGKQALLDAVHSGLGFAGLHAAADSFHTGETVLTDTHSGRAGRYRNHGDRADPYVRMLGAEFIVHGRQQVSTVRVVDPAFPGMGGLGSGVTRKDEWYSLADFSHDLHVLLVQETAGMVGTPYQRPPYPSTWARRHGRGRVFYTSLGHGDNGLPGGNCWTQSFFLDLVLGGLAWTTRQVDADITPNIERVTPGAWTLPPYAFPVT
ncbi:MAG TPA: ThuA domain-containing protein [Opitutaceae bacterium]|jgi:hypothetical protein